MRKIFVLITVLLFVIFSCNELSKKQSSLLGVDKLTAQLFKININKDTVLKTLNGAFFDIPKSSISSNDSLVQLEIKEAYSLEEIIKAGLTTQSNGQPLSSGGMIYINAAGGQTIKITKAIKVAVPTKFFNNKMQLYKGQQTDSGINWTNPTALAENPLLKNIDEGELLFKNNCSSCHKVDVDFTGPALAHVIDRKGKDWVYHYSHNFPSQTEPMPGTIKEDESDNDNYTADSSKSTKVDEDYLQMNYLTSNLDFYYLACLKEQFKTKGPNFPSLKNAQLDAIYKYIKNETERLQVSYPNNNYTSCLDSCEIYFTTVNKLLAKRKDLKKDSVQQKVKDFRPPAGNVPSIAPPVYPDNSVEHEDNKSLYYQFKIDVVGWYNIDALLNSFDEKMESELRVRIVGTYKSSISVNLVVPIINTFLEGGKLSGKEVEYGFFTKDGKIPLPKNAKAYIIAMGETNGQMVFSKKEFIVSEKQTFEISPEISTVEEFNASIKAIGSSTVNIKAIETPTGRELKENDKQLKEAEKLKPKNCSCDCGLLK
jgi:cytochrome c2